MNNKPKVKNYGRTTAHRKAMFNNMIDDFKKRGHITTTVPKAKKLKQLLQKEIDEKIFSARVGRRKGDNAELMRLVSEDYITKKFGK